MPTKLAVVCSATEAYTTAMIAQARRVVANLPDFATRDEWESRVKFFLVGDSSDACKRIETFYKKQGVPFTLIELRG